MKKKLLNIISIAVISLSLSGCSLLNDSNNSGNTITDSPLVNKPSIDDPKTDSTKPWLSGKTVKGHNFTSEITIEECDEIAKEMKQAKEYALEDSHYDYFYDVYSKLENIYYKVNDAEDIEFLEYSVYGNTTNLDNSEEFSSVKTDILQWYNEVEHIAYKNSFKEKLWEGKTDEEILKIIGEEFPDEYYELKKKMTSL